MRDIKPFKVFIRSQEWHILKPDGKEYPHPFNSEYMAAEMASLLKLNYDFDNRD